MAQFWMVRPGEGGYLAKEFIEKGCVGVGFDGVGSCEALTSLDAFKQRLLEVAPDHKPLRRAVGAGVGHKFRSLMKQGDGIVTFGVLLDRVYRPVP